MKRIIPTLLLLSIILSPLRAAETVDMNRRAEELKNLRWGMFICWSYSTFSGSEWTKTQDKDAAYFRATAVDTDQWARTAKEAGMGYILFLAKHHDGFCLWDTATTEKKVTNAPLGKDVVAELKKSCDKHGIKLAFYFSEGDWNWPGAVDGAHQKGGNNPDMKKAQLKELLTQYGPIKYIWFDHAAGDGGLNHEETFAFCKSLQPGCFIGFNHGDQRAADIRIGEMGRPGPLADPTAAGPYAEKAATNRYLLAEFTYPILPPHQGGAMWFYSLPKHDNLVHPAVKLYRDYLGAEKFGNIFSINIGPNYEGKIRDVDVAVLREVGRMIREKMVLPVPPSEGHKITASSVWQNQYGTYGPKRASDSDFDSRWGAAEGSRSGWLEIAFDKPTEVRYALVDESSFPRTRAFTLEYEDAGAWKPILTGTTLGELKRLDFPSPVTATRFRLNITEATEVPTINEFQLW